MLSILKKACRSTVQKERESFDECFAKQRHFLMKWSSPRSHRPAARITQRAVNTFSLFSSTEKRSSRLGRCFIMSCFFQNTHTRRQTKEGEEKTNERRSFYRTDRYTNTHTYTNRFIFIERNLHVRTMEFISVKRSISFECHSLTGAGRWHGTCDIGDSSSANILAFI